MKKSHSWNRVLSMMLCLCMVLSMIPGIPLFAHAQTGSYTLVTDISDILSGGEFVIGGLNRKEVVKSRSGIPFLADIPYLGYLFSSESSSVKHSRLVVAASCQWSSPQDSPVHNMTKRQNRQVTQ